MKKDRILSNEVFALELSDEQLDALESMANIRGLSVEATIRELLDDFIKKEMRN